MSDNIKPVPSPDGPNIEELSPQSRMEYQRDLEMQIAALEQKRDAVRQIQKANPIERTLLAKGMFHHRTPTAANFTDSIRMFCSQRQAKFGNSDNASISVVEVMFEKNYKQQNGGWVKVDECYIRLRSVSDARFLEQLPVLHLTVGCDVFFVRFEKPSQDDETRKTFNVIGGLAERLDVVKKELATFDLEISEARPRLASKYIDKAVFKNQLTAWKEKRSAGHPLHKNEFWALSTYIPVDMKNFQKRFEKLWDEQCDLLLKLQTYRCEYPEIQF